MLITTFTLTLMVMSKPLQISGIISQNSDSHASGVCTLTGASGEVAGAGAEGGELFGSSLLPGGGGGGGGGEDGRGAGDSGLCTESASAMLASGVIMNASRSSASGASISRADMSGRLASSSATSKATAESASIPVSVSASRGFSRRASRSGAVAGAWGAGGAGGAGRFGA